MGQLAAGLALGVPVMVKRLPMPARADRIQITALGGLSFGAWAFSAAAVRAGDLSLTATVASLYPLVTVLLAVWLTDESLKHLQILGLVTAFAGVGLIAGG